MYWWSILFTFLLFTGITFLIIPISLVVINVKGQSMSPALTDGDQVLVLRHWPARWLQKNHIVLVWPWQRENKANGRGEPGLFSITPYIKRVVGLPGNRLITKITDLEEQERVRYLSMHNELGERVWDIPEGHFFVKGDFPLSGNDSLTWGPIPFSCFLGIVLFKLPSKVRNNGSKAGDSN